MGTSPKGLYFDNVWQWAKPPESELGKGGPVSPGDKPLRRAGAGCGLC